jgi:hypothetical protein
MCEEDADREHYRHNKTIEELFAEDLSHCHSLPEVEFDLSGKGSATTNNWGRFYLNKGMHEYSASPKHANQVVNLKFTSSLVIVMDENFREIVRHRRLYGDTKRQRMEWLPYLRQLSLRPRCRLSRILTAEFSPPMALLLERQPESRVRIQPSLRLG